MKNETAGRWRRKALLGVSSLVLSLSFVCIAQAKEVYASEKNVVQRASNIEVNVAKISKKYPGLAKYVTEIIPDEIISSDESVTENEEIIHEEFVDDEITFETADNTEEVQAQPLVDESEIVFEEADENSEIIIEDDETVENDAESETEIIEGNNEETDSTIEEEPISPMDYDTAKSFASSLYSNSDLRVPSGITKSEFESYCSNMKNDRGFYVRNADFIWDTCQEYGFNEFAFIGVSAWEGGWATKGPSYNYYGALGMRFSSEHDGIEGWISFMTSSYLNPQGKFYCGGYGLVNIGPKYCSSDWTWDVLGRVQDSAYRK